MMDFSTRAIHADRGLEDSIAKDVAPPIHVSTTFEIGNDLGMSYSRADQPTRKRAEIVIGDLEGGEAILYASGLAATQAVLNYFRPQRVFIGTGYFMTTNLLKMWFKDEFEQKVVRLDSPLQKGDLVWIESPSNPFCELFDFEDWSKRAKDVGAYTVVDSSFASPVLQTPLQYGIDIVMHSCTKFIGGHSDILSGVLVTKDKTIASTLKNERSLLGSVTGSLECFLLLRSVRTMQLRVTRQSESATILAEYLSRHVLVQTVHHPSLPKHSSHTLCLKQMKGPPGIFSVELISPEITQLCLKKLKLFVQATSLGGVESMVDWRHRYDSSLPATLLRVAIGLEDPMDLRKDWEQALTPDAQEEKEDKLNEKLK